MTKKNIKHYTSTKYIEYRKYHKYAHSYIWLHTRNVTDLCIYRFLLNGQLHALKQYYTFQIAVLHEQMVKAAFYE